MCKSIASLLIVLFMGQPTFAEPLGIGQAPDPSLLSNWDIAIGPDGEELPVGQGSAQEGESIYATHCAACHGVTGTEGPDPILVGGHGSLTTNKPVLTVGSYWPYATTLYDYIQRAMPFFTPGSLTADEVYAVSAYLLYLNGIIDKGMMLNRETLPAIEMPNRHAFFPDPRPDTTAPGAVTNVP